MACKTVTVVLATYNRPDTLKIAIESVLYQTYVHWLLLVIGDHCDARTLDVTSSFRDQRIRYINMPVRSGEQSGPNSVGIALADTEYIAFLNHDDIWLNDHLEYGLQVLHQNSADFFVGKSAFAGTSVATNDHQRRPIFDSVHRDDRHPRAAFSRVQFQVFEPTSSWLVRTEKAKQVGYWQSRDQVVDVYPIQDWVRRAWRQNLKFAFGTQITVLKISTHTQAVYRDGKGIYNHQSLEHAYLFPIIMRLPADDLRQMIADEINAATEGGPAARKKKIKEAFSRLQNDPLLPLKVVLMRFLITPISRWIYLWFGINIRRFLFGPLYRIVTRQDNTQLSTVVKLRTGETLNRENDIKTIVQLTLEHTAENPPM